VCVDQARQAGEAAQVDRLRAGRRARLASRLDRGDAVAGYGHGPVQQDLFLGHVQQAPAVNDPHGSRFHVLGDHCGAEPAGESRDGKHDHTA
jgi:hypothetical protein